MKKKSIMDKLIATYKTYLKINYFYVAKKLKTEFYLNNTKLFLCSVKILHKSIHECNWLLLETF